jgi:dolichol-phosphate mannosyltransferase
MTTFSLILPTYNESENIQKLIPILFELFSKENIEAEIIVVDDDSPDLTWKVAMQLSEIYPSLHVIRRFHNKGLSSAVLAGMEVAKGKYLGVMDSDFQHDEKILPKMIKALEEYEIVVGSRVVEEGGYGEWGLFRELMSQFATFLAKLILPIQVQDPLSGFFVLRREVYEEVSPLVNPRGFKILLEFLARKRKLKVKEIGYIFRNRLAGQTKMSRAVIQDYLIALLEIRFGNIISLTFIKYCIIGTTGVVVNLIGQKIGIEFLNLSQHDYRNLGYELPSLAVGFGFFLSIINNYFLNNLWTFKEIQKKGLKENLFGFLIFTLIALVGFLVQISVWRYSMGIILYIFPNLESTYLTYICNFFGIVVATIGNYYLNKNITWQKDN